LNHFDVFVFQVRINCKVVIIDNGFHAFAKWSANIRDPHADRLDILCVADVETLEVDIQNIGGRIISQPFIDRNAQQVIFEAHRRRFENPFIHQAEVFNDGLKLHVRQNIFFQINAGRNLDEFHPFRSQHEDTPFGNIKDLLIALLRGLAAESDLLYFPDNFFQAALFDNL